jgi:hypothetical protein
VSLGKGRGEEEGRALIAFAAFGNGGYICAWWFDACWKRRDMSTLAGYDGKKERGGREDERARKVVLSL